MMDRRAFLGSLGGWAAAGVAPTLVQAREVAGPRRVSRGARQDRRHPLPRPPSVSGEALILTARESTADIGPTTTEVWTLNGAFPAPTIRLARGRQARIELVNRLTEPTILHWHGLNTPEAADGHPRFAIGPGETYHYAFDVLDRAGLYWYHPHTHRRTAPQTYKGMAGLIVVADEEESELELPSGAQDVLLILQDKRLGDAGSLDYDVGFGLDMMLGYLGDRAFGNGVADPTMRVMRGRYRFRVLNASNARIFDLGLDHGSPFTLIGSDGGLLEAPASLERVMLGTGERADLVVDFSDRRVGERIMLRSFALRGARDDDGDGLGRHGRAPRRNGDDGPGHAGRRDGPELMPITIICVTHVPPSAGPWRWTSMTPSPRRWCNRSERVSRSSARRYEPGRARRRPAACSPAPGTGLPADRPQPHCVGGGGRSG